MLTTEDGQVLPDLHDISGLLYSPPVSPLPELDKMPGEGFSSAGWCWLALNQRVCLCEGLASPVEDAAAAADYVRHTSFHEGASNRRQGMCAADGDFIDGALVSCLHAFIPTC